MVQRVCGFATFVLLQWSKTLRARIGVFYLQAAVHLYLLRKEPLSLPFDADNPIQSERWGYRTTRVQGPNSLDVGDGRRWRHCTGSRLT